MTVRAHHHDHVHHEYGSRPGGLRRDYRRSQEIHEEGDKSVGKVLVVLSSASIAHYPAR